MKLIVGLALAGALLLTGCATRYKIVLNSNNVITTKGKPKYDPATDTYHFKDMFGRTNLVPAIRIKEISVL